MIDLVSKNEGTNALNNGNDKVKTVETEEAVVTEKKEIVKELKEPRKEWIQDMKV